MQLMLFVVSLFAFPPAALAQAFSLQELRDTTAAREARIGIVSAGQPCPDVLNVWQVVQNAQAQPIFKISCSNNRDYQLTAVGERLFVKTWTGNLLGR
jgi:hypothetical protein